MTRASAWLDRHPLLSMTLGYLLLLAVAVVVVPADPVSIDYAIQHRGNT